MLADMSPSLRHFTEGLLLGRGLGTVRENTHITLVTADGPLMSFPMSTVSVDAARGLARLGFASSLALALTPMPFSYGVGPAGAGLAAALWAKGHFAGKPALAEGAKQTSVALLTCTIPGVAMVLPFLKAAADLAELRRLDTMEYVARFLYVEADAPTGAKAP